MSEAPTSVIRVLLVDDDPNDRALALRELAREFPEVFPIEVLDGDGFERALEAGGFDVVITDHRLRWASGLDVLREVKSRYPDVPVVMHTGTGTEEIAVEAMRIGLDDYVVKSAQHYIRLPASVRSALERAEDRRRARSARETLESLIDASPLAIVSLDPERRITSFNPAAERLFGWTADEVLGGYPAYVPEDDREAFEALFERLLAGEQVTPVEIRRLRRDGTMLDLNLSSAPIRDAEGRIVGVIGIFEDITERKRNERELRLRMRAEAAVAELGLRSLAATLPELFDEAVGAVARTLEVPLAKILELAPEGDHLRLVAGVGWREGAVGRATVPAGRDSQAGFTLLAEEPVVVEDLEGEMRFSGPKLLFEHGVRSGVSCVIRLPSAPFGVIGAHTREHRRFTRADADFLQAVANVLAAAIERDRKEAALREAEARWRSLVEQIPGNVYVMEADGSLSYNSPQVEAIFGYTARMWEDDPWFWRAVTHPDDLPAVEAETNRALDERTGFEMDYRMLALDGSIRWVHDTARYVGVEGSPPRWIGLATDITNRKAIEDALRAAEERFRRLVEQIPGAVYIEELDRSISYFSPRVTTLLGYPPESFTGGTELWEAIVHPDDREAAIEADVRMVEQGIPLQLEYRVVAADGRTVWVDDRAIEVPDPTGTRRQWLGLMVDVTERRRAQEELAVRAAELARLAEERQRLLRQLVTAQEEERARVGLEIHDGLGQVLTSIALFTSDLEERLPPEHADRVIRIRQIVERAIVESRQLVWSLRPPELEVHGLVPAVLRLIEHLGGRGPTIRLREARAGDRRLPPEVETVVFRIIQEALNNAVKHSRASTIDVALNAEDGVLRVLVEDDGRGFDANRAATGVEGLGLLSMRERAALVQGTLTVDSREGAGTRVRLEIPIP
jgi:PAS domain S-box-containing protein